MNSTIEIKIAKSLNNFKLDTVRTRILADVLHDDVGNTQNETEPELKHGNNLICRR